MAKKKKVSVNRPPVKTVRPKKPRLKKVPRRAGYTGKAAVDRYALIEKALRILTKQDLMDTLMILARGDEFTRGYLEGLLKIDKPLVLLFSDIKSAIDCATEIDESQINYNFDYDYQAYADIQAGFESLIKRGEYTAVKTLALILMKCGSLQVECSDEGLMSEEIEDCLKPVIKAVKSADSDGGQAWAKDMLAADRVGFICDSKLRKMAS